MIFVRKNELKLRTFFWTRLRAERMERTIAYHSVEVLELLSLNYCSWLLGSWLLDWAIRSKQEREYYRGGKTAKRRIFVLNNIYSHTSFYNSGVIIILVSSI